MARTISLLIVFLIASAANAFAPAIPVIHKQIASCSATALPVKIKVEVGDSEPIESALRRFKREVNKSGHLMELRHRRYFENSQERQKRKVKEARIRKKFERMQRRRMAERA